MSLSLSSTTYSSPRISCIESTDVTAVLVLFGSKENMRGKFMQLAASGKAALHNEWEEMARENVGWPDVTDI